VFKLLTPAPYYRCRGFISESANYAFTDFTIAPVNVIDPLNVTAASISADCSMDAMYPSAV
jgi:hypothetical protein